MKDPDNNLPSIHQVGSPLILASASPRRKDLLALTGLDFDIYPVNVDESSFAGTCIDDLALELAIAKADEAARQRETPGVILAADTVVIYGGEVLGKPKNAMEAVEMLNRLRDDEHEVMTSVVLLDQGRGVRKDDTCKTIVPMRAYSIDEVETYVASGSPMDKAGAYGIQDASPGVVQSEDLHGCFANVMGLPICHFTRTMRELGYQMQADVPNNCRKFTRYDCPISEQVLAGKM